LVAFNQMIDSWSAFGLGVFSVQAQSISWGAGVASMTPALAERPSKIESSSSYRIGDSDYNLEIIGEAEYNGLTMKTFSAYPEYLYANMTVPDVELYLYPVPNTDLTLNLISVVPLAQSATLADDLIVPPGYLRAFRYGLAVELAPEYGIEPPPTVAKTAMLARRQIVQMNAKNKRSNTLSLPAALTRTYSDIQAG
jgi:hypothetical protein